ncbi:MAG: hypothetical protein GY719_35790 [bacterium]|nr:hypothetical protein [bacterium]
MNTEITPDTPTETPLVVWWFKVYAGILALIYLATAAISLIFFIPDPADLDMSATEANLVGGLILFMGLGLFAVCLAPFIFKPRPWLWVYDLVLICIGFTSICTLPGCIALLIYWIKPETKTYFGRT